MRARDGEEDGVKRMLLLVAVLAAAVSFVGVGSAQAYGGKAEYQVGFAFNCDIQSSPFCVPMPAGFGLGGEWGWYAFYSNNTFDAEIAFCAHGQGLNGGGVESVEGTWKTGTPTVPLFGQTTDFYISTDGVNWQDTLIPADAGHYATKLAPGVSAEAQVAG